MTPEEKQQIRGEIEKRLAQTQASIESLKKQTKPIPPDNAIGRLTRMDAIQQKSVCEANLRSAEVSLKKLEVALERIDEANFGLCGKCGKNIPVGRILLVPETNRCVDCA